MQPPVNVITVSISGVAILHVVADAKRHNFAATPSILIKKLANASVRKSVAQKELF